MADDKKSIILDLLARNKMRKDTQDAADDLDRLGTAAEETDRKTERLGETSEKTGQKTDKMGNSLESTKGRISGLDKEIESVDKELKSLSASFADAGSSAERNDISKAIRRTQNELRNLTKNRDVLKGLIPDENETKSRLSQFAGSLADTFESIGAGGGQYLVAGLVAAAPIAGAAISGAIIGGAGLTGIVGGVVLATKDPRVQSAIAGLKTHFGDELKQAAEPFIPVTLNGMERIRKAVDTINFKGIFADAAKQAPAVFEGIGHLIERLGGGLEALVKNSGPVIDVIGKGISRIGDALGSGLEEISRNGKDSAQALDDLFGLISNGITVVFKLVDGLTHVYGALHDIGVDIGTVIGDGLKAVGVHGEEVHGTLMKVSRASLDASDATVSLAKAQEADQRASEGQRDALSEVSKELRKQTDPAFALLDATDQLKQAQKDAAAATRKYGANSEEARAATRKLAEAALTLQGDVGALGSSFNGHLSPALLKTLQAAKLTKPQIAAIEAELRRAKKAADAYAGRYVAEIITNYTYNVGGNDYNREANRGSFSGKRAAGGPFVRGMPYLVGENGPEIVVPDDSGRVLSAAGSRGLIAQGALNGMSRRGGDSSGFAGPLELKVAPGGDQYVASMINGLIRTGKIQITAGSSAT